MKAKKEKERDQIEIELKSKRNNYIKHLKQTTFI